MIRSWLDLCTRAHQPACAADLLIGARDIRPTRLLEVSAAQNMGSGRVRVVNSCGIPSTIEYATLSHRWHENLTIPTSLKNGMWTPLNMLDRLFAEAAVTAKSLGQSYLWIDALCIDQGSSEDKAREIALMGQYYGNAAFNIVAASDLRPSEKLWRIRSRHVRPFKVQIRLSEPTRVGPLESSADISELSVKSFLLTLSPILHRDLSTDTESVEERLDSRGWVLQERALARRSIFFGDTCVWFSCACLAASENYPEGYEEKKTKLAQVIWESEGIDLEIGMHFASSLTLDMIGRVIRVIWNLDRFKQLNFEGARPDLLHLWYGLLQDYWKRNLTYDSDFIVALSGIAFSMSKGLNSDYIAGLWKDDIIWGLGWRVRRDRLTRPNVTSCAPSWSWASMDVRGSDRQITMHKFLKPHRPLITNVQVTWSLINPKNQFGDVCDAKIEARGYLHPIDCTCSTSQTACDTVDEPNSFRYDIHWDLPPSCADRRGSHKILVLPLYVHIELIVVALALESVSKNVFRRVGLVDMRDQWIDYFEECPLELTRVVIL
ncbi:heterokaryon incompatibility protein-domain-containing protein [Bisporella sp. PMI_857]|nr:heterokaryon incompatibility protein-domain-containing protein [Bisporella sp. PMI_857]